MRTQTSEIFGGIADYSEAFRATDITSARMKNAIKTWINLYYQHEADSEIDPSQQIPYTIVRKLTKTVFSEYSATSTDAFARMVLRALDDRHSEALQMMLIGGESLLKPIPFGTGFYFAVIPRQNVRVFGRDITGRLTDIGTDEKSTYGKHYYTLLERRTVDDNGFLTIQNSLFRSLNADHLGERVPLNTIPRYAQLVDEYTYPRPVGSIGLVGLKTPMANCIDGSDDGVSVYAAAVGLIHAINKNEAQINGEFERAESRILASADFLRKAPAIEHDRIFGKQYESHELKSHLFAALDGDPEEVGITIFSPQLREQSFLARKQEYLRNVENVIGMKRGLLSEVEAAERTATEITSSAGEYNLTIIDLQRVWEGAVKEALRLCSILGDAYKVTGAHAIGDDAFSIDWGNGILYDENKAWEDYKSMVSSGLLKPEIALGWRFGMPTETEEDLGAIRKKYMPVDVEDEVE